MKHINIEQFSNGELTQQINRELEAVAMKNIKEYFAYELADDMKVLNLTIIA